MKKPLYGIRIELTPFTLQSFILRVRQDSQGLTFGFGAQSVDLRKS